MRTKVPLYVHLFLVWGSSEKCSCFYHHTVSIFRKRISARSMTSLKGCDERLEFPAVGRNKEVILNALEAFLPSRGTILEVASGSGEHCVAFAARFPNMTWVPSDMSRKYNGFIIYIHYSITTSLLLVHWFYIYVIYISFLISPCTILTPVTFSLDLFLVLASHVASINAWRDHMQIEDTVMRDALFLDASAESWPRITENNDKIDGVMCINMIHIAPWKCCLGLLRHSATLLKPGAPLIFYGPFIQGELETALSNIRFDESLKDRNSEWGLRTLESVRHAGMEYGFTLVTVLEVPANNLIVIFRKQ